MPTSTLILKILSLKRVCVCEMVTCVTQWCDICVCFCYTNVCVCVRAVADVSPTRLELPLRTRLRTERRKSVPGEETAGGSCDTCGSCCMCHSITCVLMLWILNLRWNRINTKSCRTSGNTFTPVSPTSAAFCCLTPASESPPTQTLMGGYEARHAP